MEGRAEKRAGERAAAAEHLVLVKSAGADAAGPGRDIVAVAGAALAADSAGVDRDVAAVDRRVGEHHDLGRVGEQCPRLDEADSAVAAAAGSAERGVGIAAASDHVDRHRRTDVDGSEIAAEARAPALAAAAGNRAPAGSVGVQAGGADVGDRPAAIDPGEDRAAFASPTGHGARKQGFAGIIAAAADRLEQGRTMDGDVAVGGVDADGPALALAAE